MRELFHSTIRILIGLLFITIGAAAHAADLTHGDYYIVNKNSQKALTAFDGKNGAIVVGQSAPGPGSNAAQRWTLSRTRDGSGYSIRPKLNGAYLTTGDENDNGDTSVVVESAANEAPSWRLHLFQNGYGVESGNSGLTLNITGGSSNDHAAIIVYEAGTYDNRQWLFYPAGNTRHSPIHVSETSRFDNRSKQYKIAPLPSAARESERTRREKLLDYQPSGLYVKKGEAVSVTVAGLATSPDGLMTLVGPRTSFFDEDSKNDPQFVWAGEGRTDFTAKRSGLIYFQYTDSGFNARELPAIDVAVVRGDSSIPFYIEGQTSFDEWRSMLAADAATPFIEMMNKDALDPSNLATRDPDTGRTVFDDAARYLARKIRAFDSGVPGDDGSGAVWVRLVMFDQLRQAFGSSFYPRLHKDYREHPLKGTGLATADLDWSVVDGGDKALKSLQIQTFILRASRTANQDLTKFFTDWGLPLTQETASALRRLNLPAADPELSRSGLGKREDGNADPMKTTMSQSAAASGERRCGWYSNPTPGNLLLTDKEGDWWIQMQGRPDPEGIDNVPAFDDRQFVETNVPGSGHGYGCACMTVVTNAKQKVTRVISGNILPLARCRNDRSLPKPG